MQKDINAPFVSSLESPICPRSSEVLQVPQSAFVAAATVIQKQITPDVIKKYQQWRDRTGLRSV
jgi:AAA family ATPase